MEYTETLTTFTRDQEGVVTSKSIRGDANWMELLHEFIYFLEGSGFHGILERVAVYTGEVFTPDELGWYGATFNKYEDNFQEANRKANLEFMNRL